MLYIIISTLELAVLFSFGSFCCFVFYYPDTRCHTALSSLEPAVFVSFLAGHEFSVLRFPSWSAHWNRPWCFSLAGHELSVLSVMIRTLEPAVVSITIFPWCPSLSPHWNTVSRHYHHTGTLSHVIITTLKHCLTSLSPHWENIVSRHYHHTGTLSHVIITTMERCLTSLSPHWNAVSRHYHHTETLSHVIITTLKHCLTSLSPHWENIVSRHYHHTGTLSHVIIATLEHCLTSLSPHLGKNCLTSLPPQWNRPSCLTSLSPHWNRPCCLTSLSPHWNRPCCLTSLSQRWNRPRCLTSLTEWWPAHLHGRQQNTFFLSFAECLHVPRHAQNHSVLISQERRTEGGGRGTSGNVWKEPEIDYCLWPLRSDSGGQKASLDKPFQRVL